MLRLDYLEELDGEGWEDLCFVIRSGRPRRTTRMQGLFSRPFPASHGLSLVCEHPFLPPCCVVPETRQPVITKEAACGCNRLAKALAELKSK